MVVHIQDNRHKHQGEVRNLAGEANIPEGDHDLEEALDAGNPGEVGRNLEVGRNNHVEAHSSEEEGHGYLGEGSNLHLVNGLNLLIYDLNTR